jgi:hypothetical protein
MATLKCFVFVAAAALLFMTCPVPALADKAAAAEPTAKSVRAASAANLPRMLEKRAYAAWKSRDAKFWGSFLSDRFVGYGATGKLDKASATRQYTGADCNIRRVELSDERTRRLGHKALLVTHKTTIDGTCSGQKVPAENWAASIYVRDGARWQGAFHAEAPIVDPKAGPPMAVGKNQAAEAPKAGGADTAVLLALEKQVWEAWKEHDPKKIAGLTADDVSFINIFGTYLPTKADALKDWSGTGCEVKSVSVTNAVATMLSPTVGILTFDGAADGTCYGQKVGPIWGTSVYVKTGNTWKWTFGINLPAPG